MNHATQTRSEKVAAAIPQLVAAAGDKLEHAPDAARKQVRRYPLATVGIAFGAGVALGIAGWALFAPRPPTFRERFDARRLRRLLDRLV